MRMKHFRLVGAVLLALGMAGLRPIPTHAATTITVNTCDESHLDAAVAQANSDNDDDTITFGCTGTITLTSGLFITGDMSIDGNGQNVVIDGGNAVRLFEVSAALTLDSLTLSAGSSNFGAAIYNTSSGTLYITNTTFSNNTVANGPAGAIYNRGTIHLDNSTFSGNSAELGGAIDNDVGQMILAHATFSGNTATGRGGAIDNDNGGTVVLTDGSSFTGNSATGTGFGLGGAIFNCTTCSVTMDGASLFNNTTDSLGGAITSIGSLTVTNSVFSGNSSGSSGIGGALDVENGTARVTGSTFSSNSAQTGGAVDNFGSSNFQINSSTFSGNTAGSAQISGDGGAILNETGTTTITGSTFSGNSASSTGGAIRSIGGATLNVGNSTLAGNSAQSGGAITTSGDVNLTNSTITANTIPNAGFGGGLFVISGAVSVGGTILAGNTAGGTTGNCRGSITDSGYNLEDGTDCGFTGTGSRQNTDPQLASSNPQGNGGPTSTIALQSGSPGVDQIPVNSGLCPATDQRGYGRPDTSGSSCDIGAYEYGAQPPAGTALGQVSGAATYGGTATLTATLTDTNSNPLSGEKVTFRLGSDPVCDVPGEPSCPETDGSGVATVSGVVIEPGHPYAITYAGNVHAAFDGDTGYAGSTASGDLTVSPAGSSISATPSSTSITYGQSFTVDYEVSSAYGVAGGTTTGIASVVEDAGPGNLRCTTTDDPPRLSANQSAADGTGASNAGFDAVVNSSTNSTLEFTCSPDQAGEYTYHVHFHDTDNNYTSPDSSPLHMTVNQQLSTTVAAVSGSATYGGTATFTATLQDANRVGVNGKTITFQLWNGGGYTTLCGGSGQADCPTTQTTDGTDGVATLSGVALPSMYADAGTYSVVEATFAGDSGYLGSDGQGDLTVAKADQTISFGTLSDKTYGDPDFGVSASATSGLAVSFGATGNCSVSSGTVHLTGAGSCTITASQGGNNDYNAAPGVPQSFSIAKEGTEASLGSSTDSSLVGQQVTFTATISPAPDGGTVTFQDGGASMGCDSQPVNTATGTATCAVSFSSAGSHSITAAYNGDNNFLASPASTAVTQTVGYAVHVVSAKSLTFTVQLWNASSADVSASALTVTAECVVPFTTTAPTTCPTNPVRSLNQPFTFHAAARKTGAQYSYSLSNTGLTRKHSYYLLVQADSDPAWHAIQFTD